MCPQFPSHLPRWAKSGYPTHFLQLSSICSAAFASIYIFAEIVGDGVPAASSKISASDVQPGCCDHRDLRRAPQPQPDPRIPASCPPRGRCCCRRPSHSRLCPCRSGRAPDARQRPAQIPVQTPRLGPSQPSRAAHQPAGFGGALAALQGPPAGAPATARRRACHRGRGCRPGRGRG